MDYAMTMEMQESVLVTYLSMYMCIRTCGNHVGKNNYEFKMRRTFIDNCNSTLH